MRKLIFIFVLFPIFVNAQVTDSEIKIRIDSLMKVTDSIGKLKNEGIVEGTVVYSHKSGNYGWDAYFLNDIYNEKPLRIRYSESQPKSHEYLNLYYENGILVFAELTSVINKRNSKRNKTTIKKFYFHENEVFCEDINDSDLDYILDKEKTILKLIYD